MNLDYVRYLLAVKKYGSITKASQHIFVSQPNMSKAIKSLEIDLGIKVLSRSTSGSLLTKEGMDFLKEVQPLIERLDFVSQKYMEQESEKKIHMVTLASSMMEIAAFEVINETKNPLVVSQKNMAGIIKSLNTGMAQYGFVYLTKGILDHLGKIFSEEKLKLYEVLKHHFYLVTSKTNHVSADAPIQQIANYTCVFYEEACSSDLLEMVPFVQEVVDNQKHVIRVTDRTSEYLALKILPDTFSISTKLPAAILEMYGLEQIPLPQYEFDFILLYKDEIDPVIYRLLDQFVSYF